MTGIIWHVFCKCYKILTCKIRDFEELSPLKLANIVSIYWFREKNKKKFITCLLKKRIQIYFFSSSKCTKNPLKSHNVQPKAKTINGYELFCMYAQKECRTVVNTLKKIYYTGKLPPLARLKNTITHIFLLLVLYYIAIN